jgi:hypothetical protein
MTEFKRLPLNEKGELIKNGWGLKSPRNLVIVKYPKSGATLSLCNVPKILIADSERGTEYFKPDNVASLMDETVSNQFKSTKKYGFIPQTIFDLVDELGTANKMDEYWKALTELENERDIKKKEVLYNALVERINEMPFPILAVDTITSLVAISNEAALYEYNQNVKTPKYDIKKVDEYGGSQYIRRKFSEIKKFIEQNAAPFIQYHGHVASRKKVLKKDDEDVNALDIALDGILSTIFTSQSDAVCTFYRDDKGCFLDFLKKDETDLGSRPKHLSNKKIKIADIMKDGDEFPKTYWEQIYPEVKFK